MEAFEGTALDRLEQSEQRVKQAIRVLLHMADTPHALEEADVAAVLTILQPVAPTLQALVGEMEGPLPLSKGGAQGEAF